MKIINITAKRAINSIDLSELRKLNGRIGIVATAQYAHLISVIKKELDVFTSKTLELEGQVLGCDASAAVKINDAVDSFVFLGDGSFHPLNVALKTRKPVFILGVDGHLRKLDMSMVKDYERKILVNISKARNARSFGILVSIKPGQNRLKQAVILSEKLRNSFIFVCDNILLSELLNFPDIDCWINSACPRLFDDLDNFEKPFINLEDVDILLQ